MKMNKQEHIATEIAKDTERYLGMKVVDVQDEIGRKLKIIFEERGWTNGDMVVYGTLLCMARVMHKANIIVTEDQNTRILTVDTLYANKLSVAIENNEKMNDLLTRTDGNVWEYKCGRRNGTEKTRTELNEFLKEFGLKDNQFKFSVRLAGRE